jgi:hypothetical protein
LKLFKNPEMAIITKLKNCPTLVSTFIPWYQCRCGFHPDRQADASKSIAKEGMTLHPACVLYKNSSENLLLVRFTFLTKNVHICIPYLPRTIDSFLLNI